jgi:ubiquinone/menaquinone biosynthesis C-methylase UbiE
MFMTRSERQYLPAAGHDWFLPLYDPLTRVLGVDSARGALLEQAALRPGFSVLDVGCGTGTLAVSIKRQHPQVDVIGVDPDPRALERAKRKAKQAGVSVRFDQGFGDALGYADRRFDRVFSSMMFHHLESHEQQSLLLEIRRVLKPDGRLELLDFEGPESDRHRGLSRLIHSHHRLSGNSPDRILTLLARAGFSDGRMTDSRRTLFGRIAFFQAAA